MANNLNVSDGAYMRIEYGRHVLIYREHPKNLGVINPAQFPKRSENLALKYAISDKAITFLAHFGPISGLKYAKPDKDMPNFEP